MNFQHFFFATYPGYFPQALPIALAAGVAHVVIKSRKDLTMSKRKKIFAFVCLLYNRVGMPRTGFER